MTKKANFIIPLVIYPFDVMVSLGETDEQLKKSLKKTSIDWDDLMICRGVGRTFMDDSGRGIIRLKSYPHTCEDYGVLQHEIFHYVTFIMDKIGMKLNLCDSDEAYSYLIGYLTTQIYLKINSTL